MPITNTTFTITQTDMIPVHLTSANQKQLKVFANNEFLGTIEIPGGPSGRKWHVFNIINGEIEITNKLQN